ncbi:MAG: hypothetical protein J1E33_02755 [Alistipes sp.]|nr:hypothetical protein [Alistipes sp.]
MLNRIIISKLSEGGRLVIPRLGTFFVREDGHIVFSELLRTDDGVLRGLLVSRGVGESEAAGVVDRFVFEIRHTIEHNRPYRIGTLGILFRDERGIIRFSRDAAVPGLTRPGATNSASAQSKKTAPTQPETAAAEPLQCGPESENAQESAAVETVADDRPVNDIAAGAPSEWSASLKNGRPVRMPARRRGADIVLVVAALTLLAALGVIVYGYFTSKYISGAQSEANAEVADVADAALQNGETAEGDSYTDAESATGLKN